MRHAIALLMMVCLTAGVACAADTDGDGISDEIETQLGLLPQVKQDLIVIANSPNAGFTDEQAKANAPDILLLEGAHVGDKRLLLKITFAHPVDFSRAAFIVYADLDSDAKTGRVDQYHGGTDTMFSFSDRTMGFTYFPGHDAGNTGARMAKDGNVLYLAIDAPFKQAAGGKLSVGLHLLSQREGGRGDSTPHVVAQLRLSSATVPKLPLGKGGISRSPSEFRYWGPQVAYEKLSDKGLTAEQVTPAKPIEFGRPRPQVQYFAKGRQPEKRGNVDVRRVPVELLEEAGVARQAAILSFGFPLPQGALFSLDKIKLVDGSKEVPAQFTATGYWPDESLKWVLIDATVPLKAGEKRTVVVEFGNTVKRYGYDNIGVREDPQQISIHAGRLPGGGRDYTISREHFGLISAVVPSIDVTYTWRAKRPLVTFDPAGVTLVDEHGKGFAMGTGRPETVVVEQRGRTKVVVRAEGAYTAGDGSTCMRYIARLTFHALSPVVEVALTHVNDTVQSEFSDITSLSLPLHLTGGIERAALWSHDQGASQGFLQLLQRDDQAYSAELNGKQLAGSRADGVITADTPTPEPTSFGAIGWRPTTTVGAVVHDFWQRWPKGISVKDDQIVFDLLPQQPSAEYGKDLPYWLMFPFCEGNYRLKWGMAFTEKISFDFSGKMKPEELWAEAQMPIVPVIPAEYYAETKALGSIAAPRGKQFAMWDRYVDDSFKSYMDIKTHEREYGFLNYGDWFGERGRNWGNNEYDLAHGLFMHFARTGNRDAFRWATKAALHRADVDTIWYYPDPFNVGGNPPHSIGHTGEWTEQTERAMWTSRYNSMHGAGNGHSWTDGIMDDWHLTGNPRSMESALAFGEHVAYAFAPSFKQLGSHERSAGWSLRAIMALYKGTYDPVYLEAAQKIVTVALKEQKFDNGGAWPHVLPKDHAGDEPGAMGNNLFLVGVLLGGLQAYHEETQDPAVLKSLEAGAAWIAKSFDEKAGGWPYSAKADGTPVYRPTTGLNHLIIGPLAYIGRVTNNERLLHIAGEAMAAATVSSPGGNGKGVAQHLFFTSGTLAELQRWYEQTLPDKGLSVLNGSPESMAALLVRSASSDRHSVRAPDEKIFHVRLRAPQAELVLTRTPHGAMTKRADLATLKALDAAGKVVQEASTSTDEKAQIKWQLAGQPGDQFKIVINDDQRGVWSLQSPPTGGEPVEPQAALVMQTVPEFRIGGVGRSRFYFMVPQGAPEFRLKLLGVHTGPYGAVVLDPAGKVAGAFQGNNPGAALIPGAPAAGTAPPPGHPEQGELVIKPAAGQTGKVWSVILTAAGDIGIELVGVPPYLALSPEDWFEVK